jgi:hypothetical protein
MSVSTGLVDTAPIEHAAAVVSYWGSALGPSVPIVWVTLMATGQVCCCALAVDCGLTVVGHLCQLLCARGAPTVMYMDALVSQRQRSVQPVRAGARRRLWCAAVGCVVAMVLYACSGGFERLSVHGQTSGLYGGERDEVIRYMPPRARQQENADDRLQLPNGGFHTFFDGLQMLPLERVQESLCTVRMPNWGAQYARHRTNDPVAAQQHPIARGYNLWRGSRRALPTQEEYRAARRERYAFTVRVHRATRVSGLDGVFDGLQTLSLEHVQRTLCTVAMPRWSAQYNELRMGDAEAAQRHSIARWYNLWRGSTRTLPTRA